jgi:glycosyltransferase involved in cell wall biosynthesis
LKRMKAIQVSNHFERASAGFRLNMALQKGGIESSCCASSSENIRIQILQKQGKIAKASNVVKNILFSEIQKIYKKRDGLKPSDFNPFQRNLYKLFDFKSFDIIHFHWVTGGFFDIKPFMKNHKVVWTFHGVWPITGGCHINYDCTKWQTGCGECPQLGSDKQNDLSFFCWKRKYKHFNDDRLTIITPSQWLADMVKKSPIFTKNRILVLPNCIDTQTFRPFNKYSIRKIFEIPYEKAVIMFVAANITDEHKGLDLLFKALEEIADSNFHNKIHLLIVGLADYLPEMINLKYSVSYLGKLIDEITLALAYNCADVFVGPSRQDNLPTTFIEAASCGIPSVGFNVGGIPEIVDHKVSGYLANPFETSDLAQGIMWVLQDESRYKKLSVRARDYAVNRYSMDIIARKHIELYRSLINISHKN